MTFNSEQERIQITHQCIISTPHIQLWCNDQCEMGILHMLPKCRVEHFFEAVDIMWEEMIKRGWIVDGGDNQLDLFSGMRF